MPTDLPPASSNWSPVVLTPLWATTTASPYPSCSCDSSTCEAHTVCYGTVRVTHGKLTMRTRGTHRQQRRASSVLGCTHGDRASKLISFDWALCMPITQRQ